MEIDGKKTREVKSISLPNPRQSGMSLFFKWLAMGVLGLCGVWLGQTQGLAEDASRFLGVFVGTVVGLIVTPVPGQQVVLLGVLLVSIGGILPIERALSGYADTVVWLVLCACLFSRGMIKTGLGKRIALNLISSLGKSTLGLGYALVGADLVMASVIPSNGARSGGIIFPIAKSLCDSFDSKPGPTAKRLGAFLMPLLYQADVIVCAVFITGQASNLLIAKFAKQLAGVDLTYGSWAIAMLVPGMISLGILPLLLYKFSPPEIKVTASAPELARMELSQLGPISFKEKLMIAVFGVVIGLWTTTSFHHISYTVTALLGVCTLLLTQVIEWNDVITEKGAWDIFIWYGGLVMLASGLQSFGITQYFASKAAESLAGQPWQIGLIVLVAIYSYAHYSFASVTAHVTAMFVPFLSVILSAGAPPWLAVLTLAAFSNLCACLTHFGTTPGPIYFGAGFVSQKSWWKIGFWLSIFHTIIWGIFGVIWWKVLEKF